ncbi:hypothetical protein DOTSEDRAFT_74456 [Dothistroma septosporum NZE10]|uniref:Uncharacterized protein n=1 Tax=Dothistroma septosporum (strain NZE10 / CBS 128990) TaxID=675120 RepID=N1PH74_DOTSN|nr:hypothetical protein DOTSEDRAFT_74456 [Dothistroma septosporum NZE10]
MSMLRIEQEMASFQTKLDTYQTEQYHNFCDREEERHHYDQQRKAIVPSLARRPSAILLNNRNIEGVVPALNKQEPAVLNPLPYSLNIHGLPLLHPNWRFVRARKRKI